MSKAIFYQAELKEIKGNVLDSVYPELKGTKHMPTIEERMGNEHGACPECSTNKWWLYPKESSAVVQSGKQWIECMYCGHLTHL